MHKDAGGSLERPVNALKPRTTETMANDLMTWLIKANDTGEDVKFVRVLAVGRGGPIDLGNLGLKKRYILRSAHPALRRWRSAR